MLCCHNNRGACWLNKVLKESDDLSEIFSVNPCVDYLDELERKVNKILDNK